MSDNGHELVITVDSVNAVTASRADRSVDAWRSASLSPARE